MPIVYRIWNKQTGRGYVGQTVRTLDERWRAHISSAKQGSKFRFHSAIRKYGVDAWNMEVLLEHPDISHIREQEVSAISQFGYQTKGVGYNAKPGGCGGWIVSAEKYADWRSKQSDQQGANNGHYSGISNEDIVVLLTELSCAQGFIAGQGSLRKYAVSKGVTKFPKSFSKHRFGGKYSNLVHLVSTATGLDYRRYHRSAVQRAAAKKTLTETNRKRWQHKC